MKKKVQLSFFLLFFAGGAAGIWAAADAPFLSKRMDMIQKQIAARGITDRRVLEAMRKVERHKFVPGDVEALAYEDHPLPIGRGQTISQPYIVAFMTEAAQLRPEDKVLEIGTGSGYQAAVLAEIVDHVYSIEIIPQLAASAGRIIEELGYDNISIRTGDGYQGWPEHAPFDAIIVTAAPPEIPEKLIEQLKAGGRLIVPVGTSRQELQRITKTGTGSRVERLLGVRFVPMVPAREQ